ncbi:heat shock protein Hsp90 family protein [Pelomyxa schiedti]|nr:heat shock protein Hsp90 family protein [Pelomyxa schiedti]KAH3744673.1 heat shock protein Hsp90 family protein [Pelomyxa schiedti]
MKIGSNKRLLIVLGLSALVFGSLFLFGRTQAQDATEDADDEVELNVDLKGGKVPLMTDAEVAEREERAMSHSGYSIEEQRRMRDAANTYAFQAEVAKLMNIIVHSLYTNKEVFLRELLSNGSDALDKIRFLSLTDPSVLGEGDVSNLDIKIKIDPEAGVIEITDKGIGMTKEELVANLGTVAQSGTTEFLEKFMKGDEKTLIGKFGVGFYAAFLVADVVTVTSKSNADPDQWIWQSKAAGSFSVTKDPHGNTLGRGTKVTLLLNQQSSEFLNPETIKALAIKYSEYINFPIYLWNAHDEEFEVPVEKDEDDVEEELPIGEQTETEEEAKPKTKTETRKVWSWERLNDNKPLWLKPAEEVTEEEYNNFYKALTKEEEEPIARAHFSVEGDANFKALLYIPATPPMKLWDPNPESHRQNIKLYVRRVFITGDFYEIMPSYLRFIKGIVDSDDISLNVSREQIQESQALEVIKKKLIRKSISMFQDLFKNDRQKYEKFYDNYRVNIKVGILEDPAHKDRLSKLLLFRSTKSEGKLISLDEYIDRMKEGQKEIYLVVGDNAETISKSPLIERLVRNDYEVLLMTDPIDEYLTSPMFGGLAKFDKYKFVNIGRDGVKLDIDDEDKQKEVKEELEELTKFLEEALEDDVEKVVVSTKLESSPAILVSTAYGLTANMEKIMKSQTLAGSAASMASNYAANKRIMEINPTHPLIKEMHKRMMADKEDPTLRLSIELLYRSALLQSGFTINDPAEFANLMNHIVAKQLNVDISTHQPESTTPEAPLPHEEYNSVFRVEYF